MDDSTDTKAEESEETVGGARERLKEVIGTADSEIRGRLSSAVTVAGERSGNLRSQLETLSQRTAEIARPVLESVRDHIEDNDIDVTIAENKIHIEGDDTGLQKIEADIKRAVKGSDVHVEYDREGGISLEINEGGAESEGS